MDTTLLISEAKEAGGAHWLDWWLRRDRNAALVALPDRPRLRAGRLIEAVEARPYCWLVAQGAAAALVAEVAAARLDLRIAGALLVTPGGRGALSLAPLPFPATLVASRDDPGLSLRAARGFAQAWGARFVDYGAVGRLDAASGFGPWPDGPRLLAEVGRRRRLVSGAGWRPALVAASGAVQVGGAQACPA